MLQTNFVAEIKTLILYPFFFLENRAIYRKMGKKIWKSQSQTGGRQHYNTMQKKKATCMLGD